MELFDKVRELDSRLKRPVGDALFSLFDSSGVGLVSFRDFCRALSWCCRGTHVERLRFLFCLFAIYEHFNGTVAIAESSSDQRSASAQQQQQLLHEELALGDLDDEDDSSPKLGAKGLEALFALCGLDFETSGEKHSMSFKQFLKWSDSKLPKQVIDSALAPLSLLSSPSSERLAVEEAWREARIQPGESVFLVSRAWFDEWCVYVGLDKPLPSNQMLAAPTLPSSRAAGNNGDARRPDELDNSALQGGAEGELRSDAKPGVDFVVVPRNVWELMLRWYGGGPALGRTALSGQRVQYWPLSLRLSVCDEKTGEAPVLETSAKRVGRFDPKLPLSLLERQELLLRCLFWKYDSTVLAAKATNRHDEDDDATANNGSAEDTGDDDDDLRQHQRSAVATLAAAVFANDASYVRYEQAIDKALRIVLDSTTPATNDSNGQPPPQQAVFKKKKPALVSLSSPLAPSKKLAAKSSAVAQQVQNGDVALPVAGGPRGGAGKSAGEILLTRKASHNGVRLWCRRGSRAAPSRTRSKQQRQLSAGAPIQTTTPEKPLPSTSWRIVLSTKYATLEGAGIEPWDELMVEFTDASGNWPRARFIEPPEFRNFKVGDRVEACDYRGQWFPGSIRAVYKTSNKGDASDDGIVHRVRVNFDRYAEKWDEWYDITSPSLAPPGSRFVPKPTEPAPRSPNEDGHAAAHVDKAEKHTKNGAIKDPSVFKPQTSTPEQQQQHLVPGATGLVNLGNTCFMNAALQCLSHTPLLRAYCLSENYASEINRSNPLGSQGRMVEEFAFVLRQLWSEQYRWYAPKQFKKSLAKVKPQFQGNDQHDSQEFLAEMLDMLHEDVNRVVDKPYVVEPDDDEIDKLSSVVAGREAWDRYLLRNRSVIVDLFQGQLMSERRCTTCDKRSLKFETFMYLSVPLPAPRDRVFKVALLPKPPAAASPTTSTTISARKNNRQATAPSAPASLAASLFGGGAAAAKAASGTTSTISSATESVSPLVAADTANGTKPKWHSFLEGSAQSTHAKVRMPRALKFAFELPRLGTIADLKNAIEKKTGVLASELSVGAVFRHRVGKLWGNTELLARVGEEDVLVAYESSFSAGDAHDDDDGPPDPADQDNAEQNGVDDDLWPNSFDSLALGDRVDALDFQHKWCVGSIVKIDDNGKRQVRFDRFSPKWNEWYGPEDFGEKLAPPYSKSQRRNHVVEIQVVHRRERPMQSAEDGHLDDGRGYEDDEEYDDHPSRRGVTRRGRAVHGVSPALEIFGTPLIVRFDTSVSVAKLHAKLRAHALSLFAPTFERRRGAAPFVIRLAAQNNPSAVRWQPPQRRASHNHVSVPPRDQLNNSTANFSRVAAAPDLLSGGSKLFVGDLQLEEARLLLTLDWTEPSVYEDVIDTAHIDRSCAELDDDDVGSELAEGDGSNSHSHKRRRPRGSTSDAVPLASCLDAFTKEETLSDDNVWFCPKCKASRRAVSKIEPWKLPDILVIHMKRFLASSQWREKINTRVDFPLTALDMSPWVSPEARAEMPPGSMLFDLFAVINHLGVISGGHYTASVRAVPCSRDGVEEVASSFPTSDDGSQPNYRWLHVDDDIAEEIGPHQIVTNAAYVLFYRREHIDLQPEPSNLFFNTGRRLTPSTVINLSSFNAGSSSS